MSFRVALAPAICLATLIQGCQAGGLPISLIGRDILWALGAQDAGSAGVQIGAAGGAPGTPGGGAAPDPAPGADGTSSGAGAGAVGEATHGQVLSVAGASERPLAAATVRTSDGRSAITSADGRFVLRGAWPADSAFVVSAAGHVASAVAGLAPDTPLSFHLQARGQLQVSPDAAPARLRAVGRVVGPGPTFTPLQGLTVVLEDADGAASAPATTDVNGAFELQVFAPQGRVTDGTVLVVGEAENEPGSAWLGMATGVTLSAASPQLDLDATAPGDSPLIPQRASHPVRLAVDTAAAPANPVVSFELVSAGASLSLPIANQVAMVAPLPGARFALRAEAVDGELGTQSKLYQDDVRIDFSAPETVVTQAMLAPPEVTSAFNLVVGELMAWHGVPGATAYQVSLAGLDAQGALWEAFSEVPSLTYTYAAPLASGRYGLTVTAWDAPGLSARSVMAAGPRALRTLPLSTSFRKALRQVRRSLGPA